eukprot:1791364-Rhodomonas_salina.1
MAEEGRMAVIGAPPPPASSLPLSARQHLTVRVLMRNVLNGLDTDAALRHYCANCAEYCDRPDVGRDGAADDDELTLILLVLIDTDDTELVQILTGTLLGALSTAGTHQENCAVLSGVSWARPDVRRDGAADDHEHVRIQDVQGGPVPAVPRNRAGATAGDGEEA